MKSSTITATDMFCGAGGQSQAARNLGLEVVVAANHWQQAIDTHAANFPETEHDCADISQVDPRKWPSTTICLASPECTNFSSAKNHYQAARSLTPWNSKKEAERSRATMWDVPRFASYHGYQALLIENVVEVRSWRQFDAWIMAMESEDYHHEIVYFNSQFAPPTPQSRDRMYTIFWKMGTRKPDLQITPPAFCDSCDGWVEAVQVFKSDFHEALARATKRNGGKRPDRIRWGLYGQQYDYRCPRHGTKVNPTYTPAYTAIDWSLPSQRIGDRKKPLADATLARIQRGIEKYGWGPALVPLSHTQDGGKTKNVRPLTEPMMTQTSRQDIGLAHPFLTQLAGHGFERANSTCRSRGIDEPLRTQTTTMEHGLVFVPFIVEAHGGGSNARSVERPLATIEAGGNHHWLCEDGFLIRNYGSHQAAADWHVMDPNNPLATVTAQDHHGIVQSPNAFLDTFFRTGGLRSVQEPMGTQTTHDRHALVEIARKVDDCYYRMLEPPEAQRGMGFNDDYVVLGTKRDKVRQLGNAVTPPVIETLLGRIVKALDAA